MKSTPLEALIQRAQERPKDVAFIFRGESWTCEMIASESERLARGMMAIGVKPGDRVALHMTNRPEFIVAYYACFRLGAIAAPLRTAFTFAELGPILQRLAPALYIGDADLYDNVAAAAASVLPYDRRFIVGAIERSQDGKPWEKLLDSASSDNLSAPAADQPAVLITTSGTTSGEPKFVVHTAATLAASAEISSKNQELSDCDVIVLPLALAHMSGLLNFLCHMRLGGRVVLFESFKADAVLDAIEYYGCTRYNGFPAQYAALLSGQQRKPRNLQSLRACVTGGDVCPIDLQRQITSLFGAPLYNVWGSTEAAGSMKPGRQVGPAMRVAEGVHIRLIDKNGNDVADGEIGELLLRGPNLFASYWNDPQATAEAWKDGWFHTGDLMRHIGQDEFVFAARKKDIIIRGGTNISPIEVEQAILASHPEVEEAAVVGVPDPALGQRVLGFVKLIKRTNEEVVAQILHDLTARLAAYKVPERLIVLDALPRNALSKIDRRALQALANTLQSP